MRHFISILTLCISISGYAQTAFKLYTKAGKEVKFEKMIKEMSNADVVLLGELHTNPISHWMQLRITEGIYLQNTNLVLGAEMFEADNQLVIDEYLANIIRAKDFEKEARLWDNYVTDYKPLMEFAHTYQLPFVATNIPRRYAAVVNKQGLDSLQRLSEEAKKYVAPLPIVVDTTNPSVTKMQQLDFGHPMPPQALQRMINAQAIKDATMAHFIQINRVSKGTFVHYQGDFHSANYGGIYWYLQQEDPKVKIITLSTVEASGNLDFDTSYTDLADYILVVADDMTQTMR